MKKNKNLNKSYPRFSFTLPKNLNSFPNQVETEKSPRTSENPLDLILPPDNNSLPSSLSSSSGSLISNKPITTPKVSHKIPEEGYIVIDQIESIFSKQIKVSFALKYQYILILIIILFGYTFHWIILFLTYDKKERNYCYNLHRNQLNVCSSKQACKRYEEKINIFLYDLENSFDNNNYTKEINDINNNYQLFFSEQYENSFQKNVFYKYQADFNIETLNCVYVIGVNEKWNLFIRYFSICHGENIYYTIILIYLIGGALGVILVGLLSDIFGRRRVIVALLGCLAINSIFFTIFCFVMNTLEQKYKDDFDKEFKMKDFQEILKQLYYQEKISIVWRRNIFFILLFIFLGSFCTNSLFNVCLSLLVENSLNDTNVLFHFGHFYAFTNGFTPLLTYLIYPYMNNISITFLILSICFIVLTILAYYTLHDSMRQLFEFSEWSNLTDLALKCLPDLTPDDFSTPEKFHTNQESENHPHIQRSSKRQSLFMLVANRINEINNHTKRNSVLVIKRQELINYPYIVLSCMFSNRIIKNTKLMLFQTSFFVFILDHLITREFTSYYFVPIIKKGNYIVNTSFFILGILQILSVYVYVIIYRISNFKSIIIYSVLIIAILSFISHFFVTEISNVSVDLNEYSNEMDIIYQEEHQHAVFHYFAFIMKVLGTGSLLFLKILICKYSRTLYRCSLFGSIDIINLISFALSEAIKWQLRRVQLFIIVMIFMGILSVLFINEARNESYVVNDIKRSVYKEKR